MGDELNTIFVYGTLMKGEYNHSLIVSSKYEGEGYINGFNLYNLGSYPGIRPSVHKDHIVYGEVYSVDNHTLSMVNCLEGEGNLYLLKYTEVTMKDRKVIAGVYVYNHKCRKNNRIHSGCWKQNRIYIAYGSNMNSHQMLVERCPTAKDLGVSYLDGYRLLFRANKDGNIYATVEEEPGNSVPVILWAIDSVCENELDYREGFHSYAPQSSYYIKKTIPVEFRGEMVSGIIYLMINCGEEGRPSDQYLNKIIKGYEEHGLQPRFF